MRNLYLFLIILFFPFCAAAQIVTVSGLCMNGNITLNKIANIDGKVAYQGTGTVLGINGVTVTVYWIGAPDNLWVIDYEGQPYFLNPCNTLTPPATGGTSCTWSAVEGTECPGGTPLVVNGTGVLPVSLEGFAAKQADNQVLLVWKTTSELNSRGFEIQRSNDAKAWNKIGFINSSLATPLEKNYSFKDVDPLAGKNFYRLLQFDLDGKPTISPIVNVDIFKAGYYTIGNNPGNGIYRLNIHSTDKASITVSDMSGRILMKKQMDAGIHQLDISQFAQGTYLLRLQTGNAVFTEKLIRE